MFKRVGAEGQWASAASFSQGALEGERKQEQEKNSNFMGREATLDGLSGVPFPSDKAKLKVVANH
jgi:hypothetical protein